MSARQLHNHVLLLSVWFVVDHDRLLLAKERLFFRIHLILATHEEAGFKSAGLGIAFKIPFAVVKECNFK